MRLLGTSTCGKKTKRCRDGVACVVVSVVFGTAIPTSLYMFGKCFSYLFVYVFSTLKEDVVLASILQNPTNI